MPKWWLSHEEFINQNSKRPPIDGSPMACMLPLSEAVFLKGEDIVACIAEKKWGLPEFLITSGARYSGVPQSV